MKAIAITRTPEIGRLAHELQLLELPPPAPEDREVLIQVAASCINVDDIHHAEGTFFGGIPVKPKPTVSKPVVMGIDVSGVVLAVGSKVTRFEPGDEVFGISNPRSRVGSWAEQCCIADDSIVLKPADLSHESAAASAVGGLTACGAVNAAKVQTGQRCLVVGASGGIGSLITQLLKERGAFVIGVCSTRNVELVQSIGADRVIDYTRELFSETLYEEEGAALDAVFDCIGGREVESNALKVLKKGGAFVTLCGPVKYVGDTHLGWWGLSAMFFYIGRRLVGNLFAGPKYRLASGSKAFLPEVLAMAGKDIHTPIDRIVPLEEGEMRDAVAHVATHRARGKVIVSLKAASSR